jgi:adenylate cyclase
VPERCDTDRRLILDSSGPVSGTNLRQRLLAILAADAAGYSRLMAVDERATVAALDAARAVFKARIESNRGRLIDTAGDSVLAVFETATGAVVAALEIQDELAASGVAVPEDRRMRFRIGLHLGDVIEKADGTVYGDGVNIAARLQALAEPGGITVSESIRSAVKGKVGASFEDQGERGVKNVADPVRVWRVCVGAAGSPDSPPPSSQPSPADRKASAAGEIDLSLPDKPSIAVLPFVNMSGEPEQEYFTDGITEDTISRQTSKSSAITLPTMRP